MTDKTLKELKAEMEAAKDAASDTHKTGIAAIAAIAAYIACDDPHLAAFGPYYDAEAAYLAALDAYCAALKAQENSND